MNFTGTSGNDHFTGTSGADAFDMSQGGDDIVSGGDSADTFAYGAAFTANDQIDGGSSDDTVTLDGDYSAGVTFKANTMVNVETLTLTAGHDYNLTLADATVGFGQDLLVDASALGAGNILHFNGSKVSSGSLVVEGGAGNDVIAGGQHGNNFQLAAGGDDNVRGGAGQDQFAMGASFTANDRLDGGGDAPSDTLSLNGDYSAGVVFKSTTMVNIDSISLAAGHSYKLTIADATFAPGEFGDINGTNLGAADKLTFDASHEASDRLQILGGAGNDVLTGGSGSDIMDGGSGADIVNGGAGDDFIDFETGEDSARINGGDGNDTLQIFSGFETGYAFKANQLTSIENIVMADGSSYTLTSNDANVAAGQILVVDASQLTGSNFVSFNGVHETNGNFGFHGGAGNDIFVGGSMGDSFYLAAGGDDFIKGGAGDDLVFVGAALTATDHIDGGTGSDTVTLDGDYSAGLTFKATTIINEVSLILTPGHSYHLTTADQTVGAGKSLFVGGGTLGSTDRLLFNGAKETDGHFLINGGDGNDIIVGGHGNDSISGGLGADKLTGGAGGDVFAYGESGESSSTSRDTITDLDGAVDKFDVTGTIAAIDTAITTGSLSTASFDHDLTLDVNTGNLATGHAVLFTASAGTLSGDTFLVIDQNGTAGYQAGEDLIIQLTGATHLNALSTSSFI